MNKEHKIYTEEEVKSYFKDNGAIKYTIINPFSGYEEDFYHDCGIASISVCSYTENPDCFISRA